jgi:formylglycine-generating enzyme required for sulfatase activity
LLRHGKEGPAPRPLDWGQGKALEAIDGELARKPDAQARQRAGWYVNGQGQTFTFIRGPVEFLMGAPHTDAERLSNQRPARLRISRNYAIASKAVTVLQWQRFLKDRPDVPRDYVKRYSPEADAPIVNVSWYMAAAYCNWLSEKEGLPQTQWCYPKHGDIRNGMRPVPNYLKRTGYRLPTEAEWEYACRAGAVTSRYYGSGVELLPRYAWFRDNSPDRTWPVGQKRPNDLGLFDMHGNVWTWTSNQFFYHPRTGTDVASEDVEDTSPISDSKSRVLRGAAFVIHDAVVRAVVRYGYRPDIRGGTFGVRPARTLP